MIEPEETSYNDLAAAVSDVVGQDVSYRQVSFNELAAQLRRRGMNTAFVEAYIESLRAKDEKMDNVASRTSATIGPTSFRRWSEENLRPALHR